MQDNIITWNLENWVSVVLMASLGFAVTGFVLSFVKGRVNTSGANGTPTQQAQ